MKIREAARIIDAEVLQGAFEDIDLVGAYTSDLLSDVMANATAGEALVTIQAHKNTVAVAGLVGVPAILICNGRPVPEDMITAARDEGIALLRTNRNQFQVSGLLWAIMGKK
jgi:predicted transcriptional regulator